MAKAQVTVNITIQPAVQPEQANPSQVNEQLQVGVAVQPTNISVISGGVPPYGQPVVDPSSPNQIPPGLTFAVDANGNLSISGTPTAPGQGTVILDIPDSLG